MGFFQRNNLTINLNFTLNGGDTIEILGFKPRQTNEPNRKSNPVPRNSGKPAPTLATIPKPVEIKTFL